MNLFDDMIYVGIVGSRRRDGAADFQAVLATFKKVYVPDKTIIVSGGCEKGGDRFAEMIAKTLGLQTDSRLSGINQSGPTEGPRIVIHYPDVQAFTEVPVRWRKTRANYARNTLIAQDSRDHLIAVVAPDRMGGTEHTIKEYRRIWKREARLA